jgi:hypothetical protein
MYLLAQLLKRWRQEDLEFMASLSKVQIRPYLKNKVKQTNKRVGAELLW